MKSSRIIIVGMGQIGTSIALGLRRLKKIPIVGVDIKPQNLKIAFRRKAISRGFRLKRDRDLLHLSLASQDLIILATPVKSVESYLRLLPQGPLIIDVGSTKGAIVKVARRRHLRFIGTHPIAGREKEGAIAGDPQLFKNRLCLLTPLPETRPEDRKTVRQLWRSLGAEVELMESGKHDRWLAYLSHLPHVAAYALVMAIGRLCGTHDAVRFAFGGLRDTTRIAASSPVMWADIFLSNRGSIRQAMVRFKKELDQLAGMIERGERSRLLHWLSLGQAMRKKY
ncbi:MAG: prephenate dehydrogenase/arogenate dehydrogenase family protein [Deltaproteobacteria bacterium]|nr:prephenate dehydrogenase/arogenate dehydrogenase family protein [Deltaproteobacteria bacterium]